MSPVVHNKINPKPRKAQQELVAETTIVIASEDGQELVGVCDGPTKNGECPWKDVEGRLPCIGSLIVAGGWTLKVAEDATRCPAAMLGLAAVERK
jgi:hypothetical protein